MKLSDLELTEGQLKALKSLSEYERQALLDAVQHIYLTSYSKESRDAAKRLKDYLRKLTLGENNRLPSDGKEERTMLSYLKI